MSVRPSIPLTLTAAFALLALAIPAFAQEEEGAEEEVTLGVSYDYRAYWYELKPAEGDAPETVVRLELSMDEYDQKKSGDIDRYWFPLYQQLLAGNFKAGEPVGIAQAKAQRMVLLDANFAGRIRGNPGLIDDTARRMAQWSSFSRQLDLWGRYISQAIFREALNDKEKPSFEPSTMRAELPRIYDEMKTHADAVSQKRDQVYYQMVAKIDEHARSTAQYKEWLDGRERDMLDFAEKWGRQFDGSEFRIENTLYLVRNIAEKPEKPEEDRLNMLRSPDSVILDVAKEKKVTPFDLIAKDGTLVKPQ